jgi:UDP-sugar transporter A1/2/3
VVGLVVKHAGGVRKGFAILAGILITGLVDVFVAGNLLTWQKLVALPLVLLTTYVHIVYPV